MRQAGFLRALACGLLGDEHAGEDVVQTTWLAALERPQGELHSPRAWLARVARRAALRRVRSEARRAARERAVARPEALPSAGQSVERESTLRAVTDAVLALAEPWRSTILARYFEGLEAREIAARDDLPVATVRSRIARAHELLRLRLDRDHGGDRQAWSLGLLALVGAERAGLLGAGVGATTSVTAGALIMSANLKLAAVSFAALLGMLGLWWGASALLHGEAPEPRAAAPRTHLVDPGQGRPAATAPDLPVESATRVDVRSTSDFAEPALPGTGSVHLRVLWSDGAPAENVLVKVHSWGAAEPFLQSFHARTDSAGEVRLEELAPGAVGIYAQRGGFARATVEAGAETAAELVIAAGLEVSGRVVDLNGRSVPGAEIWLSDAGDGSQGAAVATSDASGRFVLRDVSNQNAVSARKRGFAPAPSFWIEGSPGDERELVLVLQGRGASLDLLVSDTAGEPVEGARVRLIAQDFELQGYEDGQGSGTSLRRPISYLLVSDAEGRCTADSLLSGPLEVIVSAVGRAPWTRTIELPEGSNELLELTLTEGVCLSGVVHTSQGEPLAGATVRVGSYGTIDARATTSADDGSYCLRGIAPGSIEAEACLKGLGRSEVALVGVDAEQLRWDPQIEAGRVLRGRLVDERGAGLVNWMVNVGSGRHGWDGPSSFRGQTRSDPEGRFRIVNCPEGPLWANAIETPLVSVFPEGEWEGLLADGDERVFTIPDDWRGSAYLRGRTLGADGRGASAKLTLRHPDRDRGRVIWSAAGTGSFQIGPLAPATYLLAVEDATKRFTASLEDLRLSRGTTLDVGNVLLGAPGRLALDLHPAEGVDLARVTLTVTTPAPEHRFVGQVRAEESTQPLELPVGHYELHVFGMVPSREVPFAIEADATTRLALDLVVGARLALKFDLPHGRSLPVVLELVFRAADGNEVRRNAYLAEQEGVPVEYATQIVVTLPPAEGYSLEVSGPDGLRGNADVVASRLVLTAGARLGPPLIVVLR